MYNFDRPLPIFHDYVPVIWKWALADLVGNGDEVEDGDDDNNDNDNPDDRLPTNLTERLAIGRMKLPMTLTTIQSQPFISSVWEQPNRKFTMMPWKGREM